MREREGEKKKQSEATVCALWTMCLSRSVINTLTLFISFVEKKSASERARENGIEEIFKATGGNGVSLNQAIPTQIRFVRRITYNWQPSHFYTG